MIGTAAKRLSVVAYELPFENLSRWKDTGDWRVQGQAFVMVAVLREEMGAVGIPAGWRSS